MKATLRAAPSLATMIPDSGTATTAPSPPASRISPMVEGLACNWSRIAGSREAQLANPNPLQMKAVATARLARSATAAPGGTAADFDPRRPGA